MSAGSVSTSIVVVEDEEEIEDNIRRSVRARRDELNRWFSAQ